MTKGAPASGKSTWAKEQVINNMGHIKRLNRDDLRSMIDNGKFTSPNEVLIVKTEVALAEQFFAEGHDVIIDDCNLAASNERRWRAVAEKFGAEFIIKDFTNIAIEKLIERDLARPKSVGEKVIRQMIDKYIKPTVTPIEYNALLPDCWLVDIDNTLAIKSSRSPYDWMRVGEDGLNTSVARLILLLRGANLFYPTSKPISIVLLSGRDSVCRDLTTNWLNDNHVTFDSLYMRPENDNRPDTTIKLEFYNNHIKGKFNVLGVFDDRLAVVRLWHSLGLSVFRVGDPDANF